MGSTPLDLPDLSGLTIVVLGDYVADEYLYGETDRISREAPVPIVRFERSELKLGAAGNVASNLRALGVRVRAVGALGADTWGRGLRRMCRTAGIEVAGLLLAPGLSTSVKTRVLAGALQTTRQQLLRLDRESMVEARHAKLLEVALKKALRGADALIISDYGLGNAGPWVAPLCAQLAKSKARSMPVCVDSRYNLGAFRGVTLIKPNAPELAALANRRSLGTPELLKVGRSVLKKQRVTSLLVTRGRDGMVLFEQGEDPLQLPVSGPLEAVDVTGAGDTVLAVAAAVLARTGDFELAARLSNVAGGLVVQKPGTAVVTAGEIRAALVT
jgi:rfaE bifunctional protein kinase chain/domain